MKNWTSIDNPEILFPEVNWGSIKDFFEKYIEPIKTIKMSVTRPKSSFKPHKDRPECPYVYHIPIRCVSDSFCVESAGVVKEKEFLIYKFYNSKYLHAINNHSADFRLVMTAIVHE